MTWLPPARLAHGGAPTKATGQQVVAWVSHAPPRRLTSSTPTSSILRKDALYSEANVGAGARGAAWIAHCNPQRRCVVCSRVPRVSRCIARAALVGRAPPRLSRAIPSRAIHLRPHRAHPAAHDGEPAGAMAAMHRLVERLGWSAIALVRFSSPSDLGGYYGSSAACSSPPALVFSVTRGLWRRREWWTWWASPPPAIALSLPFLEHSSAHRARGFIATVRRGAYRRTSTRGRRRARSCTTG